MVMVMTMVVSGSGDGGGSNGRRRRRKGLGETGRKVDGKNRNTFQHANASQGQSRSRPTVGEVVGAAGGGPKQMRFPRPPPPPLAMFALLWVGLVFFRLVFIPPYPWLPLVCWFL